MPTRWVVCILIIWSLTMTLFNAKAAIMESTHFTKKGSNTGALLQYVDGNTVAEEKNNTMALGTTPDASGTPRHFERSKDMCTEEEQKILLRWVSDLLSM